MLYINMELSLAFAIKFEFHKMLGYYKLEISDMEM